MASLVLAGNTSGSITISSPSVSGTNTLTLPANTGTVITTASTFAGTGPAFRAYQNGNINVTAATFTKVQINTEDFDTASCFDTSIYRFTPNVAGYYQVNATVSFATTSTITRAIVIIYKNGSENTTGNDINASVNRLTVSALIYMNGTTDYLELYGWVNGAGTLSFNGNSSICTFQAFLARSA